MPEPIQSQIDSTAPIPEGMHKSTDLILAPNSISTRMRHFSPEVWRLDAESHIMRLAKVLLGDAGAGQLRKRSVLARLNQTLAGTHFYDLDRFYGALFNLHRRAGETFDIDPYVDNATAEEWEQVRILDGKYRSRIQAFARAITYGASPIGVELVAESIFACDVEVIEDFTALADAPVYRVMPSRPLSEAEWWDFVRVIERLQPASARPILVNVSATSVSVPILAVNADSTLWQIIDSVRTDNPNLPYATTSAPVEQPKPPWSEHQGEAWSYLWDVDVISSYSFDTSDNIIQSPTHDLRPTKSGDITYSARNALSQVDRVLGGRMVSEGILAVHPYKEIRRNKKSLRKLANQLRRRKKRRPPIDEDLFVDGVPVGDMVGSPFVPVIGNPDGMWVTPPRQTSLIADALEVRLRSKHTVNNISFDALSFPQSIEAQYRFNGAWVTMFIEQVPGTRASIPQVPSYVNPPSASDHPHVSASEWVRFSRSVPPVETDSIRLVLRRDVASVNAPVTRVMNLNTQVPFSLAVQNLDFGYRVRTEADLPWDTDKPIDVSTDIFRSLVEHRVMERPANGMLAQVKTPWISGPQPIGTAVVSLYVDTSINNDQPQIIDRWFIDPITVGAKFNIYYSNDDPHGDFQADNTIIPSLQTGMVTSTINGLRFPSSAATVAVPTTPLRMNGLDDWWMGLEVIPHFDAGSGIHPIFTWGDVWCDFSNAGVQFGVGDKNEPSNSAEVYIDTIKGGTHPVVVAYRDKALHLWVGDQHQHVIRGVTIAPTNLVLGGENTNATISALILKAEAVTTGAAASFLGDPYGKSSRPRFRTGDDPTGNSRVRLVRSSTQTVLLTDDFSGSGAIGAAWPTTLGAFTRSGGSVSVTDPHATNPSVAMRGLPEGAYEFTLGAVVPDGTGIIFRASGPLNGKVLTKSGPNTILSNYIAGVLTTTATYPTTIGAGSVIRIEGRTGSFRLFINGALISTVTDLAPLGNRVGLFATVAAATTATWTNFTYTPLVTTQLRGGPGDYYANLSWTRIPREFSLSQGFIHIPPTRAKRFKFEFSNLVPQPYETFLPTTRTVNLYPRSTQASTAYSTSTSGADIDQIPGQQALDSPPGFSTPGFPASGGFPFFPVTPEALPTEGLIADDPIMAQDLSNVSWAYGWMDRNLGGPIPAFVESGVHDYTEASLSHNSKIAFFIGLNDIQAFRQDHTTSQNREAIVDHFNDFANIQIPFSWQGDPGRLMSSIVGAEATSRTIPSDANIRGLQFATTQTPPRQMLRDDGFRDRNLTASLFDDPLSWNRLGDAIPRYLIGEQAIQIDRSVEARGIVVGIGAGIVQRPFRPTFSARQRWNLDNDGLARAYGGLRSEEVTPTRLASLTAAVRLTAITSAHAPIKVQIIGTDARVLSEVEVSPVQGETSEVTVSYLQGSEPGLPVPPPDIPPRTLVSGLIMSLPPDSNEDPDWVPWVPSGIDARVRVQVIQEGPTDDSFKVSMISLFEDPIVWEFSNNGGATWVRAGLRVRNNERGVLIFPGVDNALRWRLRSYAINQVVHSIKIRPWYDYTSIGS